MAQGLVPVQCMGERASADDCGGTGMVFLIKVKQAIVEGGCHDELALLHEGNNIVSGVKVYTDLLSPTVG